MRGLQMRLKVRNAFPLFNHHDRVRRQSLKTHARGMIHHRRVTVAPLFFKNGWNNFRKLVEDGLTVMLARTRANFGNDGKHG